MRCTATAIQPTSSATVETNADAAFNHSNISYNLSLKSYCYDIHHICRGDQRLKRKIASKKTINPTRIMLAVPLQDIIFFRLLFLAHFSLLLLLWAVTVPMPACQSLWVMKPSPIPHTGKISGFVSKPGRTQPISLSGVTAVFSRIETFGVVWISSQLEPSSVDSIVFEWTWKNW